MKKRLFLLCFALLSFCEISFAGVTNESDSAYIFAYATTKNDGHNGLHFAWSTDKENWHAIGPEYSYVKCDYGRWGSQKRMIDPVLFWGEDGVWHCIWSLNEKDGAFAHVASKDLVYWMRQTYPIVMNDKNCLFPEAVFDKSTGQYIVSWKSTEGNSVSYHCTTTKDFKDYTPTKIMSGNSAPGCRQKVLVSGNLETGTINKVSWNTINGLIRTQQLAVYKQQLWSENTKTDSERFEALKSVTATITPDYLKRKKISDLLMGVFFEDLNYAADGGLYAELIQNRDFEYALEDKEGMDSTWNSYKAWKLSGNNKGKFRIDTISPIHFNNKHYAVLQINEKGLGLINEGFDGIALKAGEKYDFSMFARNTTGKSEKIIIRLLMKIILHAVKQQ